MKKPSATPSTFQWKLLCLLVVMSFIAQLVSGIHYVTIPVLMKQQGFDNFAIGCAIACEIIGFVLLHQRLSTFVQRIGLKKAIGLVVLTRALLSSLMGQWSIYLHWVLAIFGYGICTGLLLVILQTWLNVLASKQRGMWMGLFSSAISLGVALAPFVINCLDIQLNQRFYLSGAINLCLLGLIPFSDTQPLLSSHADSRLKFVVKHARPIMVAAFIGGVSFYGLPNFLTLYGLNNGLTEFKSERLMSIFMLGSVSLGMLLSLGSDWLNRQWVILCCIFISVVSGVFLSLAIFASELATLILLYCWGGCMGAIYSIGLSVIGDRFHISQQLPANLSYNLMDAAGGITGLLMIGWLMDWFGPEGLPFFLSACGCLFITYLSWELLHNPNAFR